MTQIEKQHFLGNYIGCVIEWIRESDNTWITTFLTASNFGFLVKKKCRIIAKSIESITDEDLEQIAKIMGYVNYSGLYSDSEGFWVYLNKKNGERLRTKFVWYKELTLECFDFLRSKGYLLPFRQYSTEQLIESGIVKI